MSFFSVIVLLVIIWIKYRRARTQRPPGQRILLRTNLDIFMLNLLIGELLMSLGGVLDAKWANEAQVYCGGYCNAQGSLRYLGDTSVALWTLAIALHTGWNVLYDRKIPFNPGACMLIMGGVWGFVFSFNFAAFASHPRGGLDTDSYFTPVPFWCWINSKYFNERLVGELWLAGFGNLLVYIPLFLLLRGNIVLGGEGLASHKWYWIPPPQNNPADEGAIREEATKMLLYPLAYTIVVSPLSIVRWITFTNKDLAALQKPENAAIATATLFAQCIFRLSGVVNVCLFATRPNVLLFGEYRGVEDEDEAVGNQGVPLGRLSGRENDIALRQRNNASDEDRQNGGTGFGGPRVDLHRHEDDERVFGRR